MEAQINSSSTRIDEPMVRILCKLWKSSWPCCVFTIALHINDAIFNGFKWSCGKTIVEYIGLYVWHLMIILLHGFMSTSMRLGHILFMRQILFRFVRCGYVNIWVWNDLAWKMGYHGMHAWQGPWIDSSNHVISKNPTWWTFWASTVCYHGHYIGREDKKKMFSWTLRWVRGEDGGKSSAFECGWWEWGIRGFKSSDVINNF